MSALAWPSHAGAQQIGRRREASVPNSEQTPRFAVHPLENGADVRTIQMLPGHCSLAVTAHYLRITVKKVCSAASPFDLLPAVPTQDPAAGQ